MCPLFRLTDSNLILCFLLFYGCFYTASLSLGFNNFESAPLGSKVSQLRNLGKQFPNVCGHSPSYILTLVRRISVIARDKLDF
jgi:hypothetical protein